MATAPTKENATTTPGHESFNDIENHPQDYNQPGKLVPTPGPGPQKSDADSLDGDGTKTGTRVAGWMKLFMMLLTAYTTAYIADCIKNNRAPEPIPDSIILMLETQADHLCARYPKEISVASL